MRLIDADALKKAVNGRSTHWLNDWSTLGVLAVIDEQPTIDAVPVVRCGKCKYRKQPTNICEKLISFVPDGFYCYYGERIDKDANVLCNGERKDGDADERR